MEKKNKNQLKTREVLFQNFNFFEDNSKLTGAPNEDDKGKLHNVDDKPARILSDGTRE